jgi:hypothetical protein
MAGLQLIEPAFDAAEYLLWVCVLVGIPAVVITGLVALAARVVGRSWPKVLTLVIVGLVVALALGSPLLFARGRHLVQLYQLEEAVCQDTPPGAEVVSCGGRVGLESNGNHCDWTVEVSLTGPVDRLHYETMPAPPIVLDIEGDTAYVTIVEDEESSETHVTLKWAGGPYSHGWDLFCM